MSLVFKHLIVSIVIFGVILANVKAAPRKQEEREYGEIHADVNSAGSHVDIGGGRNQGHLDYDNGPGDYKKINNNGNDNSHNNYDAKPPKEIIGATVSNIQKEVLKKDDLFGLNGLGEWVKYIFNPCDLIHKIAEHFNLPHDKLLEKLDGAKLIGSPEALFEPISISFKVMERIFQEDVCRRRFFCQIGFYFRPLRDGISKFSNNIQIPTISNQFRDIEKQIFDRDCDKDFPECTPYLKKPFLELREAAVIKV